MFCWVCYDQKIMSDAYNIHVSNISLYQKELLENALKRERDLCMQLISSCMNLDHFS